MSVARNKESSIPGSRLPVGTDKNRERQMPAIIEEDDFEAFPFPECREVWEARNTKGFPPSRSLPTT